MSKAKRKFVLQAHFRRHSVHFDIRFEHPFYPHVFFGFTVFVDTGKLDDDKISVEDIDTAEEVIANWDRYFKPWGYHKRMGIKKSQGPIDWLKVDGLIPKKLKYDQYDQVMLILNYGKYYIFEDRLYSIKIGFPKVKTKHGAPDLLSNSVYIFRYLLLDKIPGNKKSPFYLMTWKLKKPSLSKSKYVYVEHIKDKFTVYETYAGEMMGHYLMKTSDGKWFTVDRPPHLDDTFIFVDGKYELTDTKKIGTYELDFDVLVSNRNEDYYVGVRR